MIKYLKSDNIQYVIKNRFIFRTLFLLACNGFSKKTLELVRLCIQLKQVKKVRKQIKSKVENICRKVDLSPRLNNPHEIVWVCWFQGIDDAPGIVKKCYSKVTMLDGKKVVLITMDNYLEYTSFPEHILKKWNEGLISPTHFSDLLRVELLTRHGGIWLDSTVFLSSKHLPSYLDYSSFFCYQVLKPGLNGHSIICSSWAMSARENCLLLQIVRDYLYKYWEKEVKLFDYFLFHIVLSAVLIELEETGVRIPRQCNSVPHMLQLEMYDDFSDMRWNEIKSMTSLHKLTYKYDSERVNKNSFINGIFNGKCD